MGNPETAGFNAIVRETSRGVMDPGTSTEQALYDTMVAHGVQPVAPLEGNGDPTEPAGFVAYIPEGEEKAFKYDAEASGDVTVDFTGPLPDEDVLTPPEPVNGGFVAPTGPADLGPAPFDYDVQPLDPTAPPPAPPPPPPPPPPGPLPPRNGTFLVTTGTPLDAAPPPGNGDGAFVQPTGPIWDFPYPEEDIVEEPVPPPPPPPPPGAPPPLPPPDQPITAAPPLTLYPEGAHAMTTTPMPGQPGYAAPGADEGFTEPVVPITEIIPEGSIPPDTVWVDGNGEGAPPGDGATTADPGAPGGPGMASPGLLALLAGLGLFLFLFFRRRKEEK
jgi:hypothetical protein